MRNLRIQQRSIQSLLFSTADDYEPNLKMDDNAGANVGAKKMAGG